MHNSEIIPALIARIRQNDCPVSYMCYSTKDKPYFKSRHNGK